MNRRKRQEKIAPTETAMQNKKICMASAWQYRYSVT
jgi:hypothetical protein